MPVRITVEIADEDWNGPAFQEVWGEMVEEGILKVVIEEEMPKRLLHGEKGQVAVEHVPALAGVGLVAAVLIATGGPLFMAGVWLTIAAIVTAVGVVIFAIAGEEL